MSNPKTIPEWQAAVDRAQAKLEDVRYGLVPDGSVDVARCEDLLKRAKRLGIRPGGILRRFTREAA